MEQWLKDVATLLPHLYERKVNGTCGIEKMTRQWKNYSLPSVKSQNHFPRVFLQTRSAVD